MTAVCCSVRRALWGRSCRRVSCHQPACTQWNSNMFFRLFLCSAAELICTACNFVFFILNAVCCCCRCIFSVWNTVILYYFILFFVVCFFCNFMSARLYTIYTSMACVSVAPAPYTHTHTGSRSEVHEHTYIEQRTHTLAQQSISYVHISQHMFQYNDDDCLVDKSYWWALPNPRATQQLFKNFRNELVSDYVCKYVRICAYGCVCVCLYMWPDTCVLKFTWSCVRVWLPFGYMPVLLRNARKWYKENMQQHQQQQWQQSSCSSSIQECGSNINIANVAHDWHAVHNSKIVLGALATCHNYTNADTSEHIPCLYLFLNSIHNNNVNSHIHMCHATNQAIVAAVFI